MNVRYDEPFNQGASCTHHEPVKWLSKKSCLKCNERGGVLVCSNVGCPIVVHKRCLACTAYFDDRGNFYCPYCEYKQAFNKCQKARESAILAKKTLAAFLDTKSVRSTGDDPTVECSERETPEKTDSTFRSGLVMNSEVPKKAARNGKVRSGRVSETTVEEQSLKEDVRIVREQLKVNSEDGHPSPKLPKEPCDDGNTLIRSPKNAVGHTRNHDASLTPKESGAVSKNDEETKDTEEVSYEETEEKEQQVETSMDLTQEDGSTVIIDISVNGDVNKFHAAVNSEDVVFVEHQHNKIAMDVNCSGLVNKEHKATEDRESTIENVVKVNYGVHEDENLPRNHEAVNKNKTEQNSNIGDFHLEEGEGRKNVGLQKIDGYSMSKGCRKFHAIVNSEADVFGEHQHNKVAMDVNISGLANKEHQQTEGLEPTKESVEKVNYGVHEDESLAKYHKVVNTKHTDQNSNRDDDERLKHVKLRKIDVVSLSKENKDALYEQLDTEDESKSSQEISHTGYRPRSKRKRRQCRQSESDNQCLKKDVHIVKDNVTLATLELSKLENVKTKRHETSMPLKAFCNQGMQKKRRQGEPHGMIEKNENCEQLKVNSRDGGPSEVPKSHGDNAKTPIQSPKSATCHTLKHDATVTSKEYTPRNNESVNKNDTDQNSNIGDFHFKEDERRKDVKLREIDVVSTSKENTAVSYEELDTEDESKSSQENHHTEYRLRSKRKSHTLGHSEIDNPSRNSASSSDSDFEECEEVTCVKSRQKVDSSKQNLHTPISIGRRKKLPWTEEEEDMLKEGVDKFSLIAKKNTPWLKILEFGSHIFDGTRTPDDLKDKWRRILTKAHENA